MLHWFYIDTLRIKRFIQHQVSQLTSKDANQLHLCYFAWDYAPYMCRVLNGNEQKIAFFFSSSYSNSSSTSSSSFFFFFFVIKPIRHFETVSLTRSFYLSFLPFVEVNYFLRKLAPLKMSFVLYHLLLCFPSQADLYSTPELSSVRLILSCTLF